MPFENNKRPGHILKRYGIWKTRTLATCALYIIHSAVNKTVEYLCYMLISQFAGALDCTFEKYCSSKCRFMYVLSELHGVM